MTFLDLELEEANGNLEYHTAVYQKSNQVITEDLKKPEGPLQGR